MPRSGLIEFELWSRYQFGNVEVAGESYRQDSVRQIFKSHKVGLADGGSGEVKARAHLVPDPKNKHDSNAVEVRVEGQMIGYLPKEVAATHVAVLTGLTQQGLLPVTECRIWAYEAREWQGTDRRGRDVYETRLDARASLTLDDSNLCVPVNLPPSTLHRLLPQGSALQVRGEEKHMDVLGPLVGTSGAAWVYATLSSVRIGSGRSEKDVVEVRIDGQAIGELTPAMSAHYLPAVVHLAEQGTATAARVMLKGNSLKVEAAVHAVRSHELQSDWFEDDPLQSQPVAPRSLTVDSAKLHGEPSPSQPHTAAEAILSPATIPGGSSAPTTIPSRPSRIVFAVPPGWPQAPLGWEPPTGWAPPPDWPAPPPNWRFWIAV